MTASRYAVLSVLFMVLAACGPEDAPPPATPPPVSTDPTAKLVGTWTYASGSTITTTCGGSTRADPLTGSLTVTKTGTNKVATHRGDCTVNFTVSGTQATADAGQTCLTLPVTSATLTLEGSTLRQLQREQGSGTCTLVDIVGTLTK